MFYRYSDWDGSQSVDPLDPDTLLDLLSRDLLEEGDLRSALERLIMRGAQRSGNPEGMRNLMGRLRERREQALSENSLGNILADLDQRLQDIIEQERRGIEERRARGDSETDEGMRQLLDQMTQRKLDALDSLPRDFQGQLKRLMDYEFMDSEARDAFHELVNDLRQKMLGNQFRNLQENLSKLSSEDLGPMREMIQELNQLLAKHVRGGATEQDFQDFMQRFGSMFPAGIETIDDLVDYLEQQAQQMSSLLRSMPEEMRQKLQATMQALLQDDRLQWDLMQMADLVEQITGQPLGRRYPFSGDTPLDLDEAMDVMRQLGNIDELERQLRDAVRSLDFDAVDEDLLRDMLGNDAASAFREMERIARLLEDEGLAKRNGNDLELTPRGMRRLGERTLKDLFAELRQDRVGQHDAPNRGSSSEQVSDTKAWGFGDPFLVDIGVSLGNAIRRAGPGLPLQIEVKDLEVHRREALTTSASVIAMDMSRSMFSSGAFPEAKRVAFALNTLIKSRYPRDFLELVVFSHFAVELAPERLLQSDWVDWHGTNIEAALAKSRQMLAKQTSSNRQIILITDWRPRTRWGGFDEEGLIGGLLKEVKRCTQAGIRINTFMMDREPSSMALAQEMMRINKGRVFFGNPGQVGRYVLVDYLRNKRKRL